MMFAPFLTAINKRATKRKVFRDVQNGLHLPEDDLSDDLARCIEMLFTIFKRFKAAQKTSGGKMSLQF